MLLQKKEEYGLKYNGSFNNTHLEVMGKGN
jgi:hypothetical protein